MRYCALLIASSPPHAAVRERCCASAKASPAGRGRHPAPPAPEKVNHNYALPYESRAELCHEASLRPVPCEPFSWYTEQNARHASTSGRQQRQAAGPSRAYEMRRCASQDCPDVNHKEPESPDHAAKQQRMSQTEQNRIDRTCHLPLCRLTPHSSESTFAASRLPMAKTPSNSL